MRSIRVAPIVEGHGEVQAVPVLLRRIGHELLNAHVEVLKPYRGKRDRMVRDVGGDLTRAVQYMRVKLRHDTAVTDRDLILLLVDADDDLACELGPRLS